MSVFPGSKQSLNRKVTRGFEPLPDGNQHKLVFKQVNRQIFTVRAVPNPKRSVYNRLEDIIA